MSLSSELPLALHLERFIGRTLRDGEYHIRRLLGQGGSGNIFLAVQTSLSVPFALKQLPADSPLPEEVISELDTLCLRSDALRSGSLPDIENWRFPASGGVRTDAFIREALFLARLHHPAIPALYDYFFQDGYWYLVMDYIAAPTLHTYLREHMPLPTLEALGYAIQLCEILDYLHKQTPPVLFRDLKPANVLLKPDSTLMLIDFGAACYEREVLQGCEVPLGSPGYIAPEQCRETEPLDVRADLYSLGVILYEMLSGRRPARGEAFDALHLVNPAISHVLSGLVKLATRVDPRQRFQSAHTFYLALERAYGIEERRTYQQQIFSSGELATPSPDALADPASEMRDTSAGLQALTTEYAASNSFDAPALSGSGISTELALRRALREALRQARQRRLEEEQLEAHLASVDESLKRRALSRSQVSLHAVARSSAITTPPPLVKKLETAKLEAVPPARKVLFRRIVQASLFLLLLIFVVVASMLVYMRNDPHASNSHYLATNTASATVPVTPSAMPTETAISGVSQVEWHGLAALPVSTADNATVYVEADGHSYIYTNGAYMGQEERDGAEPQYDHRLYRYDIEAGNWEVAATDFPALVNNAATVVQDELFLTAGYSPVEHAVVSALYHYKPQEQTVEKLVPPAPIQLGYASTAVSDAEGMIYLTQGFAQAGKPHERAGTGWYRYDSHARSWQNLAPLPRALGYVTLLFENEKSILLLGGSVDAGQDQPSDALYRYDIATDSWTLLPDSMPRPLSGMAGCQVRPGRLVLVGGYDPANHTGERLSWLFDVQSGHWQELPILPAGPSILGSAACDGRGQLFLVRGANEHLKPTRDFWQLTVPEA